MEKPEEYIKAFDDWVAEGNRLLKIGDTVLLSMYLSKTVKCVYTYAYDNAQNTYSGWIQKSVFGKMISDKTERMLINMGMNHITLYHFAWGLIYYNSRHNIDNTLFSFDQIDTGQLPKRVLEELMIQKLSK